MTVLAEKGVFLHGHWMKSEGQVGGTSRRDKLEGQVRGTSWTTYVYCLTLISWASARSQSGIFQPVQSSLCEQAAASAVAQIDPWVNLGSSCKLSNLSLRLVPLTCPSNLSLRLHSVPVRKHPFFQPDFRLSRIGYKCLRLDTLVWLKVVRWYASKIYLNSVTNWKFYTDGNWSLECCAYLTVKEQKILLWHTASFWFHCLG